MTVKRPNFETNSSCNKTNLTFQIFTEQILRQTFILLYKFLLKEKYNKELMYQN